MEPESAPPPSRPRFRGTENVSGREYLGCGLWVAAFLVLVVLSFTIGLRLRPDRGADRVTLTTGGAGESAWILVGETDEDGDPCVRLFRPGEEDEEGAEITGQCDVTDAFDEGGDGEGEPRPYVVTSAELPDGTIVVFAPVPDGAASVRLHLADGSQPTVEARRDDDADLSWFLYEATSAVDGPPQLLDSAGTVVDPP